MLDPLFINGDAVWFGGELLLVIHGVRLVPMVNRGSTSLNAEPLTEVSALRQWGCSDMSSARQPS